MEWNVVTVDQNSGKNSAFVSIGRGQLDFSKQACKLVNDEGQYKYAKLFTGKENNKTVVGVKFLAEYESDSIEIKRKVHNGVQIAGMIVANKGVIEKLFGRKGINEGMIRHKVETTDDPAMLKIVD